MQRWFGIADVWVVLAAAIVILVPYNGNIASHAEFEEGYLVAMLGLLFALLLTAHSTFDFACIGLLVALIYLTKSSMPLVCGVAVLWVASTEWKDGRLRAMLPALGLMLAILGWGGYIFAHTGVFAFGANESSWNGWNYYKANNGHALTLYPRILLDTLDVGWTLTPPVPVRDEWELSHAQFAAGRKFVRDHPRMVLEMDREKLYVACCDLLEAPEKVPGHTRPLVLASNLVNHLLVAICLVWMVIRAWKHVFTRAELLASLMMLAYLVPYAVGWIYMRHMVPIYSLVALVLAVQFSSRLTTAEQPINGLN
jgi:hypothetical protein